MDFLKFIGKDCRSLIYKKLKDNDRYCFLLFKQYEEEMKKFLIYNTHKKCTVCLNIRFCINVVLYNLINQNNFELLKQIYNKFQNEKEVLNIILRGSIFEKKFEIFKYFFIKKKGILSDRNIVDILSNEDIESLDLIKFIIKNRPKEKNNIEKICKNYIMENHVSKEFEEMLKELVKEKYWIINNVREVENISFLIVLILIIYSVFIIFLQQIIEINFIIFFD